MRMIIEDGLHILNYLAMNHWLTHTSSTYKYHQQKDLICKITRLVALTWGEL